MSNSVICLMRAISEPVIKHSQVLSCTMMLINLIFFFKFNGLIHVLSAPAVMFYYYYYYYYYYYFLCPIFSVFYRQIKTQINIKIQSTLVILNSLISNIRLSRSENLVPVITQRSTNKQQNIVEKRRNCSLGAISPLFHNIFNISLT